MPRDEVADLRAMAAELERQFAGYKQRLAERNGSAHVDHAAACDDDDDASGGGAMEEAEELDGGGEDVRGRMYEAYVRRRDERLRQGWRARMERKEAEVKAFWEQLEFTGRASGERAQQAGGHTTATDDAAGDEEGKTERKDDDGKKRSSDGAALAPRRITGKKHERTMSFSPSTMNAPRNSPDVGRRRRALSHEPSPPSEPQPAAAAGKDKETRTRPAGGAAKTKIATARPKVSLRRKNSVKGHGSANQTDWPKLPRSLPGQASSGGIVDDLGREVVALPSADAAASVLMSRSYEQDNVHGETPKASSPPRRSIGSGTDAENVQAASPDSSDRSEVVDNVPDGNNPGVKNADAKTRGDEEVDASSPDKLGNPNGEITSDSDIESSYVYVNKDVAEEHATSLPEIYLTTAPIAVPEFSVKTNKDNVERMTTPPADTIAKEQTTVTATDAEEAAARASSGGDSPFSVSGRSSGRSPTSSAAPSCSSRDQSIERVLEADAAFLWKKREKQGAAETPSGCGDAPSRSSRDDQSIERALEADAALLRKKREKQRAERGTVKASGTPGSAGSRVSAGAARSPKETPKGFKRFLSFGKKSRDREVAVVDCKSPSVSSVADDDSGGWQSAGSIKPRMGSSDAASDDTDHGHTSSPRAACSLQSLVAASPARSELVEIVPPVKSPKAHHHRSFFSFRALNCGRG